MGILYLFEKLRMPGLNEFFLAITRLGEETAFLVVALVFFWCIDKRRGYFVMAVGFLGTITSQFMKITCRIPRPWVRDPEFTILEAAREEASGYSFPSGHTQSAVGTFGSLAATESRRWLRWVYILLAALVGISRMYLGVHTPADVLVGAALSVIFILLLEPVMMNDTGKGMPIIVYGLTLLSGAYLLFMELHSFPADIDTHNLESAVKNAYTLFGCMVALSILYPLEVRYIRFTEKAVWWAQILKVLGGLVVVLAVKEGLRAPLDALFSGHLMGRAARYFLVVMAAGLWTLTFRFFSRLGTKGKENADV